MNRPRPRKLINVIKTSNLTEEIEIPTEKEIEIKKEKRTASISISNEVTTFKNNLKAKPVIVSTMPSVPQYNSIQLNSKINDNELKRNITEKSFSSSSTTLNNKPSIAVNSIKKSNIPPPPNYFSNSQTSSSSSTSQLSPVISAKTKSSGENFLDAADRAADFIGGAFLNSFKSLNLNDSKTVNMSLSSDEQDNQQNKDTNEDEDDPFAEIMKKLKSESTGTSKTEFKSENFNLIETKNSILNQEEEFNLMDEEPPESFEKVEKDEEFEEFELKNLQFKEDLLLVKTESSEIENIEQKSLKNDLETQITNEHLVTEIDDELIKSSNDNLNYNENYIDNDNENDKYNGISISNSNVNNYPDNNTDFKYTDESEDIIKNNSNVIEEKEKEFTVDSTISSPSSPSSPNPSLSSPNSNSIPRTGGFRASIFKHGLSALERIGKSTADVVVSTRNKLNDTSTLIQSSTSYANQKQTTNVITPNFNDRNSTFYDIFKLYGGYSKLQDLQLMGIRASIKMKLRSKDKTNIEKNSISFDYKIRQEMQTKISQVLHPDKIMDSIDDCDSSNWIFPNSDSQMKTHFPTFYLLGNDEIFCIQKLLKSLDGIFVERCRVKNPTTTSSSSSIISEDQNILLDEINSTNRRRHVICQLSTLFCNLLFTLTTTTQLINSPLSIAQEISILTAHLIKYLQTNFGSNCEDHTLADRDQQVAIKLFLDSAYSVVPLLSSA